MSTALPRSPRQQDRSMAKSVQSRRGRPTASLASRSLPKPRSRARTKAPWKATQKRWPGSGARPRATATSSAVTQCRASQLAGRCRSRAASAAATAWPWPPSATASPPRRASRGASRSTSARTRPWRRRQNTRTFARAVLCFRLRWPSWHQGSGFSPAPLQGRSSTCQTRMPMFPPAWGKSRGKVKTASTSLTAMTSFPSISSCRAETKANAAWYRVSRPAMTRSARRQSAFVSLWLLWPSP
mmetsp:Transcript_18888/g.59291  ORF Transcript_18888/g.59291 Transcript_18888/m.59291 type:complete len:242 (-) Transcript_18888:705-1430(-)